MAHSWWICACLAAALLVSHLSRADEPRLAGAPAADIAHWVKQLDSDKYAERDVAMRKLACAGSDAIGPLAKAAAGNSKEASSRAFELLGEQLKNETTKQASEAALKKLAASSDAAVARRAQAVLQPPPRTDVLTEQGGIVRLPAAQIQGQIQLGAIQAMQRVQIQNVQNVVNRQVDVNENGRQIHIQEDQQNGIDITVTDTIGQQQKVTAWRAKDFGDLKKRHPEAAAIYQKYIQPAVQIGGNGAIQIRVQGGARAVPQQEK